MQGIAMNQAIYNYLLGELYPLPQCDTCQYSDPRIKRIPCNQCEGFSKYKLHKGHEADLKLLTKGIIKIVKKQNKMELNEYQEKAMTTCMDTCNNPLYMLLMLGEEVGELHGKFSKAIRRGHIEFNKNLAQGLFDTRKDAEEWNDLVKKEIGDCLWGIAGICSTMGWSLEDVAQTNLDKLAARKAIGTIDGNGDGIKR